MGASQEGGDDGRRTERQGANDPCTIASLSLDRTLPSSSPTFNPPFNGPNEQKSSGVYKTACQEPNLNLAKMKYQATPEGEQERRSIT